MSIEQQLKRQVSIKLRNAAVAVLPTINTYIAKQYRQEEFVAEIRSGVLASDFGLSPSRADAATKSIIEDLISNTRAEFIPGNGNVLGILRVTIRTGLSESVFADTEYKSNEHIIPWLRWLLQRGVEVVVSEHSVASSSSPRSRSGSALMVEDDTGVFRTHPRWAGTSSDNVLTRWLGSEVKAIQNLMVAEIKKQFR